MKRVTKEELAIIEDICDMFTKAEIDPRRGEELLCFIAGESCGNRGGNLLEHMPIFAIGYQLGANG